MIRSALTDFRCLCGVPLGEPAHDTGGDTARAFVYHCDNCGHDVALQLVLRDLGSSGEERGHGTEAGYARHRRAQEPICEECRTAHNRAVQDSRMRRKGRAA